MKNTGGPAFPFDQYRDGMTLRDWFAGQALAGLSSAQEQNGQWAYGDAKGVASESYSIADAMIAERAKE